MSRSPEVVGWRRYGLVSMEENDVARRSFTDQLRYQSLSAYHLLQQSIVHPHPMRIEHPSQRLCGRWVGNRSCHEVGRFSTVLDGGCAISVRVPGGIMGLNTLPNVQMLRSVEHAAILCPVGSNRQVIISPCQPPKSTQHISFASPSSFFVRARPLS